MISQAEAADWARAYCFGQCRLETCVPSGPIYKHDAAKFYFFTVVGVEDKVIAVGKSDGRISHCAVVA